jgi:hypothetical protein
VSGTRRLLSLLFSAHRLRPPQLEQAARYEVQLADPSFLRSLNFLRSAGAEILLLYNNVAGAAISADIGNVNIPQASFTMDDGLAIVAAVAADPTVTISELSLLSAALHSKNVVDVTYPDLFLLFVSFRLPYHLLQLREYRHRRSCFRLLLLRNHRRRFVSY